MAKQVNMTLEELQDQFKKSSGLKDATQIVWGHPAGFPGMVPNGMYQHYTTLNRVLEKIITRRWYLTRGDSKKLNDLKEAPKYDSAKTAMHKSYIMCLCNGSSESVPMWGLYGNTNSLAIRISISGVQIEKWMRELMNRKMLDVQDKQGHQIGQSNLKQVVFRDMIYVAVQDKDILDEYDIRRTNIIRWEDAICRPVDRKSLKNEIKKVDYAGWLKDYEWHYENESRLCIRLKREIDDDVISIAIPDYVMADMRFTFSPWLEKGLFDSIHNTISTALESVGVNLKSRKKIQRFRRSVLQGALNFNF